MLALLYDPVFIIAVLVFISVMAYFVWQDRKEKEKQLEERIRKLEEKQEEQKRGERVGRE